MPAASGAESEPEFVRGALGANGDRRVPIEADSVRGRFVEAGTAGIRNALSRGAQPPRQGQRSVIPVWRGADDEARAIDPLLRTPRRSSQVLPPKGRMSFLAIRGAVARGVLLSEDDGVEWRACREGMPAVATVQSLAVAAGKVYAGTLGQGVFVTRVGSCTWQALNAGLGDMNVWGLVVYGSYLLAGTPVGLFRVRIE